MATSESTTSFLSSKRTHVPWMLHRFLGLDPSWSTFRVVPNLKRKLAPGHLRMLRRRSWGTFLSNAPRRMFVSTTSCPGRGYIVLSYETSVWENSYWFMHFSPSPTREALNMFRQVLESLQAESQSESSCKTWAEAKDCCKECFKEAQVRGWICTLSTSCSWRVRHAYRSV